MSSEPERGSWAIAAAREAMAIIAWSNIEIPMPVECSESPGADCGYEASPNGWRISIGKDIGSDEASLGESRRKSLAAKMAWRQYGHLLHTGLPMEELLGKASDCGADPEIFKTLESIRVEQLVDKAIGRPSGWQGLARAPSSSTEGAMALAAASSWLHYGEPQLCGLDELLAKRLKAIAERLLAARNPIETISIAIEFEALFGSPSKRVHKEDCAAQGKSNSAGAVCSKEPGGAPTNPPQKVPSAEDGEAAANGFGAGRSKEGAANSKELRWTERPLQSGSPKRDSTPGTFDMDAFFGARLPADEQRAARIFKIAERELNPHMRALPSDEPSKRISERHAQRGEFKYKRKSQKCRRPLRLEIVIDCSGSMEGDPLSAAKDMLAAFSDLSEAGLIKGRAIFSAQEGFCVQSLPMSREAIARVCAFSGSEGLRSTLSKNANAMRGADAVLVFTDSQVTGEPFDKQELSRMGIHPIGLYAGSQKALPGMLLHFDTCIVRDGPEELCAAALPRLASR